MRTSLFALLAAAALAVAPGLHAAELAGMKFDDAARVGGRDLQLNGLGLRSVFVVKAYVAGLYVPEKVRSAEEVLAQKGPRRISMKMLTDLGADRMIKSFTEGLEKNHTPAQFEAMKPRIDQLVATMKAIELARKGDTVDIDLADGATRISLNGQPKGQPIPGEDFYVSILRIFVGERPADTDLKKGILGG